MITTIKGTWISCNKFVTEENEEMKVTPYNHIYNLYHNDWPMECYVNIEDGRRIIGVCPI